MTKEEIVQALKKCSKCDCATCQYRNISNDLSQEFCVNVLTAKAADLIEAQAARIEELEAKVPRWIPVTERLPKKGEDGRDCTWVHCIVSVMRTYGCNWADGDVGTYVFPAPAMFDVDQKIWHVGMEPAGFTVNALIPLEDSSDDYFVIHWMPYPKAQKEDKT